jgi:phenylpropionate dioxygenase-like ring-hydroxylating dioxygenase large terminal subunit
MRSRTWQWACREEHVPEPGDWIVYDIGDTSVLVVRDEGDAVRAHISSCTHRGTKSQESGTSGYAHELRCRFHGWAWHLNGGLERVPCAWDAPHLGPATHGLAPVRTASWGGFVFINLDDAAPPTTSPSV